MRKDQENFEKLFLEAVDEGLKVLGESGKQMLYFHLEKSYSVKKNEIPKKPEAFIMRLRKIFGAGAIVLEKLILETLQTKLELKYEGTDDHTFMDYLNHMKREEKERNSKIPRALPKKVKYTRKKTTARSDFKVGTARNLIIVNAGFQ